MRAGTCCADAAHSPLSLSRFCTHVDGEGILRPGALLRERAKSMRECDHNIVMLCTPREHQAEHALSSYI